MEAIEINKCCFCHEEKAVNRMYFYPSKYKRAEKGWEKLYNEGGYFEYLYYCSDCGEPISKSQSKEIEPTQDAEDMAMTLLMNIENIGDVDFDNQEMILSVTQSALKAYANQKLKEQKDEILRIRDHYVKCSKVEDENGALTYTTAAATIDMLIKEIYT